MYTIAFRTLGCRANQYDTQMMKEKLPEDWKIVPSRDKADVSCINTCTVTNSSDSKSRQYIRQALRRNPRGIIIVTGCYAHTSPDEVYDIEGVDLVFDNTKKPAVAEIIKAAFRGKKGIINGNGNYSNLTREKITFDQKHTRAFLKIQDGCQRRCTFCKTTLARGLSRSKPISQVVEEVNELVENGYREVVFCGISLAEYGLEKGDWQNHHKLNSRSEQPLVQLLERCVRINELGRIRLSSINLEGLSTDLLKFFSQEEKACTYFHIPLQSGDDHVLRKMRRGYTAKDYRDLAEKIETYMPKATLGCDIMVGFPGESRPMFKNTCQLVKEGGFINTHIFRYSKREGTKACRYKDQISESTKKRRSEELRKVAKQVEQTTKSKYIGQTARVLVEERSSLKSANWRGYSENFLDVHIKDGRSFEPNRIVKVEIKKLEMGDGYPLIGRVKSNPNKTGPL